MNLIVLSHMYPKTYAPNDGIFVHEQVKALKQVIDGNITVIVPVPWSPKILWFKKKWREYGQAERENLIDGIKVYYPRYLMIPARYFSRFQAIHGIFIYLSAKALVKKLIRMNQQETVLHSHTILYDGFAGGLLKRKYKIPHICTIHGSDINIYPFRNKLNLSFVKFALNNCDQVVTVSYKLKEKTELISDKLNNISVINNGADPGKFYPMLKEIAKRKLEIKENGKIILFVGDLKPVKGVKYLIKAFAQLQRDYKNDTTALYLIGDGIERGNLEALASELHVEKKVYFLGRKAHDEIPLWMNAADIFVLPSISEGFPTVIPEAMMCGLPVVASNVGGIPEIVVHGQTGFLVMSKESGSLAEYIKLLAEDANLRKKFSQAALDGSIKYTWENNAAEYVKIYEDSVHNDSSRC